MTLVPMNMITVPFTIYYLGSALRLQPHTQSPMFSNVLLIAQGMWPLGHTPTSATNSPGDVSPLNH
jgi:hypothetical protein